MIIDTLNVWQQEENHFNLSLFSRGLARIFQRGEGGHTVSNIIVMAFSPRNIVGCFLKKSLTKGGSRAPQDPPSLRPCSV